ncbi:2-C-methyl-D-erythritol 4-phosphate cytidylyltransferase [Gaopeijia maritima]|uniref:2-C-methyl-D-erythritol 4-phosphate cytidylyltransferase n=1 Tax=Gaopeijia maritima TaxID=3119007 RepID=A0ABU9E8L5_9BACT
MGGRDGARRVGVAVPAAGFGRRMGGRRKAWLTLGGEPILARTLRAFLERPDVVAVAVALAADDAADPPDWLIALDPRVGVVAGGDSRAASVARAVAMLPAELDVILVHDAARPLVPPEVVQRVLDAVEGSTGAVAGLPAVDTFKRVDERDRIVDTPPRDGLWHAQTPQGFPAPLLRAALEALAAEPGGAERLTDDAMVVAAAGGTVRMVLGAARNLKVTRPGDLPLAEWYAAHPEEGR